MTVMADSIRRLVNSVFVAYDWNDALPNNMVPDLDLVDVYAEECAGRVLNHIMSQLDDEVVSIGEGFNLTDAEREAVRQQLKPAVYEKCQRTIKDDMARQKRDIMNVEMLEKDEATAAWSDRSIDEYLEPNAADDVVLAELNGER